jgi:hypothetical protein
VLFSWFPPFGRQLIQSTSISCFLLGMNTGGNEVPWSHPLILTIIPLSLVFAIIFLVVEGRYATEPILPLKLLTHRTPLATALVTTSSMIGLIAVKLVHVDRSGRHYVQHSSLFASRFESLGSKRRAPTNPILNWCVRRISLLRDGNGKDGFINHSRSRLMNRVGTIGLVSPRMPFNSSERP